MTMTTIVTMTMTIATAAADVFILCCGLALQDFDCFLGNRVIVVVIVVIIIIVIVICNCHYWYCYCCCFELLMLLFWVVFLWRADFLPCCQLVVKKTTVLLFKTNAPVFSLPL